MAELFDDISRIVGSSLPRRQALRLIGSALAGLALAPLGFERTAHANTWSARPHPALDGTSPSDRQDAVLLGGGVEICPDQCLGKGDTFFCAKGNKCCCLDGNCCGPDEVCVDHKCCPSGSNQICDDVLCCPRSCEKCLNGRTICCPPGHKCCDFDTRKCCLIKTGGGGGGGNGFLVTTASFQECSQMCCPDNKICGGTTCCDSAGKCCINGMCVDNPSPSAPCP